MTLLLALLLGLGTPADSLDLATLRAAAEARDPRAVQPALFERAAALRLEAIRAGRLPQLAFAGQATVQSAVPTIPLALPDGTTPSAPKEQARVQMEADWAVLDGGRAERQAALVRAQTAEQAAGARVALYGLREATTETFFGALLLDAQARTLALAADDLAARLAVLRARAAEGSVLSADADALEADLLGLRQQVAEAEADRAAARAVLADLTGVAIGPDDVLVVPDLDAAVTLRRQQGALVDDDEIGDALDGAGRPEFARFTATVRRAEAEARLARAATAPVVSVFGQAGVGRPSPFDFLSDTVELYTLAGVRVRWAPFDWGQAARQAEAARVQADVARTEADAFARRLRRETLGDVAEIDRLTEALVLDARIITLRQEALRVAGQQFGEGVLLPDAYTDRVTDLAAARLSEARHRIERSRAEARALSTLGLFPDGPPPATDPDALDR